MTKVNNNNKFLQLRDDYPEFIFESFVIKRNNKSLIISYNFNLSGKYSFSPQLEVLPREFYNFDGLSLETLQNLAFHIGMVELISYWKAACPPKVIIKPFQLNAEQTNWWKKLYFHGLGEFFYLNGIETDIDTFMSITSGSETVKLSDTELSENRVLVPVGGGKDSVVTLEVLKNFKYDIYPLVVNPRPATERTMNISGFNDSQSIYIRRTLDKTLLELNEKGFLNGHTPFSSLLAFISVLTALASGSKYIALSNESSANESTVPGSKINHQYSKSFEFEQDFFWYSRQYIHPEVYYFSFLRPLNELRIAALFSKFKNHYKSFRSCNVGSKTDSWCGKCSKCLFTWLILSPFVAPDVLTSIFGKNLLQDNSLRPVFKELTGQVTVKPFECVGTPSEVQSALAENIRQYPEIKSYELIKDFNPSPGALQEFKTLMNHWNDEHLLPDSFLTLLKQIIYDQNS